MDSADPEQIGVTIGVCAYNEERNIANFLDSLLSQRTEVARIEEILVVASGCTDRTTDIVEGYLVDHVEIRLYIEKERRGKALAINEILQKAKGTVVILAGADTLPDPEAVETLTRLFIDPSIGVAAARPISSDHGNTFWGGIAHVIWDLHHQVSLLNPKTGEMFAFRRLAKSLPDDVGADEDWIRNEIERRGYRVTYEPAAIVYNSGPKTVDEFFKQRVRINTQQLYQARATSFLPPTWRMRFLGQAFLAYLATGNARPAKALTLIGLEITARIYSGLMVALNNKNIVSWESLPSTKVVLGGDGETGHSNEEDSNT